MAFFFFFLRAAEAAESAGALYSVRDENRVIYLRIWRQNEWAGSGARNSIDTFMAFVIRGPGRGEGGGAGSRTRVEIRPLTEPLIELAVCTVHARMHARTDGAPPLGGLKRG